MSYSPTPLDYDYDPDMSGGTPEWHAVYTVQLGELVYSGFVDFSDPSWDFDSFDTEQRDRLWDKFLERYRYYEIGLIPPLRWQQAVLAKLNEIMPKYKPLYRALKEGYNPLQDGSERGRERNVYSAYPQTILKPDTEDYASTGDEKLFETIRDGSLIDKADELYSRYNDVDVMILNQLDYLFVALTTANINGF